MTTLAAWFVAAGAALVAALTALIAARRSGAKDEATANRAKEADAYETHLQDIAAAVDARNAVDPGVVPDDDKYRRD